MGSHATALGAVRTVYGPARSSPRLRAVLPYESYLTTSRHSRSASSIPLRSTNC